MTRQSKHQQNCARKDTRSFARSENRIKLQTHRLVLSSYPGSCWKSFGLPEVTWLASVSIAQSPTNSKHTHTHTRALQPQLNEYYRTGSASVTRGICAVRVAPSLSWGGVAKSGSYPIHPPIKENHALYWLAAFWQQPREYIQFYRKLFISYSLHLRHLLNKYNQEAFWNRKWMFKN